MPFKYPMRQYTKEGILNLDPNQNGIYGIFRENIAIYVGSGDIRSRLLDHWNGDNPCITQHEPNLWAAEVTKGELTPREGELIREYEPICNKVIPN